MALEISSLLISQSINNIQELVKTSVKLNHDLLKIPFDNRDNRVELEFNIPEYYESVLVGFDIELENVSNTYLIEKTNKWESWSEWCQNVVWYGNKKGAYLYPINNLNNDHIINMNSNLHEGLSGHH